MNGRTVKRAIIGDDQSPNTGRPVPCFWDDCARDGVGLHMARERNETGGWLIYLFCSERHKLYWANSHISLGNLARGYGSVR